MAVWLQLGMQSMDRLALILLCAISVSAVDAQRGAMILERQDCLQCHTVGGQSAGHETIFAAPDLAGRLAPTYSPSILASVLWNHTPAMWAEMSSRGVALPDATEEDWQDVFAYLYSLQFFEAPAEVGRGRQVLEAKRCTGCHSITKDVVIDHAPAVRNWKHIDDPLALAFQMWNHAASMKTELRRRKRDWVMLNGRDLLDITAFVQNLQKLPPEYHLSLPPADSGANLFVKTCAGCHRNTASLALTLRNKTFMDIAAGLWNHIPEMKTVPVVPDSDLRKIVAYVWDLQYNGPAGEALGGRKAFIEKHCITCHKDSSGQARTPEPGKTFTPFSMIAVGWGRGRQMHDRMLQDGIEWPQLTPADMRNLTAYLNTISNR